MNAKRKDTAKRSALSLDSLARRQCHCLPLSSRRRLHAQSGQYDGDEQVIPVAQELAQAVHQALEQHFPRIAPFSMLLLHVSQWEYRQIAQSGGIVHQRHRFHAPESFLEQVLTNVHRAIRDSDQVLMHPGACAALLFPDVDQRGVYSILERIYRNVSLLQAETVIPPLKYETDVLMGVGSYPEPGTSIEQMLAQAEVPARRFTLRPAINSQFWDITPNVPHLSAELEVGSQFNSKQKRTGASPLPTTQMAHEHMQEIAEPAASGGSSLSTIQVPFMQLPLKLPPRLKNLIPYALAVELRCAPVGRDHHYLTVALANPADTSAISRLQDATGMTIFPVTCDIEALNKLLAQAW